MASYYEVLGVEPDAPQDWIRQAYAEAVDEGRGDRRLDEAYAVVSDPERRRRYDELRVVEGPSGNAELLALLAVLSEIGPIPTAEELLARGHGGDDEAEDAPRNPAPADHPEPPARGPAPAGQASTEPPPAEPVSAEPLPAEPVQAEPAPAGPEPAERAPLDDATPPADELGETPEPPPEGAPAPRAMGAAPTPEARAATGPGGSWEVPVGQGASAAHHAPTRRRLGGRRTIVALLVVAVVAGIALGLLYAQRILAPVTFAEDGCVFLTEREATAVDCASPDANARISQIVEDAGDCGDPPLETLDLGERGVACLETIDGGR